MGKANFSRSGATSVDLYPFSRADGPHNMAADEVLLLDADQGRTSLRFYGWSEATLSLGYFQPARSRLTDSLLESLPWVRRPTGGAMLIHHHELTYALALPRGTDHEKWPPRLWMEKMHRVIADALESLGLHNRFATASLSSSSGEILCFQQLTPGDLLHGSHKLLGSSQRKHRHGLLQHGALLLAGSHFTPMLPGVKELAGVEVDVNALVPAIITAFEDATGWVARAVDWSAEQRARIEELVEVKYGRAAWNERR